MSIAERALWALENRLAAPPTLQALAAELGISPYGLVRAFSARFDVTPMAYLRRRRLADAARALAAGAPSILDVALASGYASHAAFSRAFRETFGATPEEARAHPLPDTVLGAPALAAADGPPPPCSEPRIERAAHGPLIDRLAGLRRAIGALHVGGIPAFWGAFAEQAGPYLRPGPPPPVSFGVLQYTAGAQPTYACAFPEPCFSARPPGFEAIMLTARRYAVIDCGGHVSAIRAVWRSAWDSPALHALGTPSEGPDVERYGPTFDPRTGAGGFSVMIPLHDGA